MPRIHRPPPPPPPPPEVVYLTDKQGRILTADKAGTIQLTQG